MSKPILWIVIPCYNEEQVLPITAPMFLEKISGLAAQGLVSEKSRVLFVNDGSKDKTWELIQSFAAQDEHYIGISQSRNRGHQNAVLAGLMEALHSGTCDVTISIDCDGQDDINAMDEMVKKYLDGAEVVYGVRSRRDTDTFFKRFTAEGFYHVMNALGADIVFNHADYRLISTRVLESFADYREVNIFLRGMVPLVGFKSEVVTYERHERLAGESHYPLSKMLALAFDGITSLSNKPIRLITGSGIFVSLISFIGVIWAIVCAAMGSSVAGWASIVCIVCFMSGAFLHLILCVPLSVLTYHGDTHPGIGNNLLDLLPYARQQKKKSTKNYTRGGVPLHELLSTLNQYLYLFSARFSIKDFPENVNLLRPAVCVK